MKQILIIEVQQANYIVLNQIHQYIHAIKAIKNKRNQDQWSQEEDQLMNIAIQIYGKNITVISYVLISKSEAQIYQRLRYLRERQVKKTKK
ncbi:Homeobox-like_domain superfamily [Hexamita inflata]|uniref:Homeobox-like_domain superfamily n=1 Tax=Hexamita inflata TaxID=28002 RepID=A0ABP1LJW2_9EUKA